MYRTSQSERPHRNVNRPVSRSYIVAWVGLSKNQGKVFHEAHVGDLPLFLLWGQPDYQYVTVQEAMNLDRGAVFNVYGVVTFLRDPKETATGGMCTFWAVPIAQDARLRGPLHLQRRT